MCGLSTLFKKWETLCKKQLDFSETMQIIINLKILNIPKFIINEDSRLKSGNNSLKQE
jgi:hypothetical protein